MTTRILGLETEYGCLVKDEGLGPDENVVEHLKNLAFDQRYGLLDRHGHDSFFEPSESGGFLRNGGRLYVDAVGSHLEYATPECTALADVVAYDKAGQRLIQTLLQQLGWQERVNIYNNSIDHFTGNTFGCHENYSLSEGGLTSGRLVSSLVPFLVTRQIFAGAGRVGGHQLTNHVKESHLRNLSRHPADYMYLDQIYGVEPDPAVDFQLSQRADHILYVLSGRVRFHRALINPKWDDTHSLCRFPRLHLLFGEANASEYAIALKMGTTSLVLDLVEEGFDNAMVALSNPIRTLKQVSRDPSWKWVVGRQKGGTICSVDLQRLYLKEGRHRYAGRDAQTDWVLNQWEYVLDRLESDPMSLADRLDWCAKRKMLELFMAQEGVRWHDEMMYSLDLEYHNTDPQQGLFYALQEVDQFQRVSDERRIFHAISHAPATTRAAGRSVVIEGLMERKQSHYVIEWDGVLADEDRVLLFEDPFHTYVKEAKDFLKLF
ncbi:MAG TPA: proteasome accessory factor PafA2 family protein [Candidatus Bipolaricaulota bacterium]